MTENKPLSPEEKIKAYLIEGKPMVDIVRELMLNHGIKLKTAHEMIDRIRADLN